MREQLPSNEKSELALNLYYPDNPSYWLLIYMLINLRISHLSENLKNSVESLKEEGARKEIQKVLDKIREYKDTSKTLIQRYLALKFLFDKLGKPLEFPSLFDLSAEVVERKRFSLTKLPEDIVEKVTKKDSNGKDSPHYYQRKYLLDYTDIAHQEVESALNVLVGSVVSGNNKFVGAYGIQPIHVASQFGNVSILKAFVEKKVDINAADAQGNTPVFFACYYGSLDCLEYLLSQGADITHTNYSRQTVLHYAVTRGSIGHVRILLEHVKKNHSDQGIDWINQRDNQDKTALHYATERNIKEIMELLFNFNANPFIFDKKNDLPFSLQPDFFLAPGVRQEKLALRVRQKEPAPGQERRVSLFRKAETIQSKHHSMSQRVRFALFCLGVIVIGAAIEYIVSEDMVVKMACALVLAILPTICIFILSFRGINYFEDRRNQWQELAKEFSEIKQATGEEDKEGDDEARSLLKI